jgi:hypothetical protein
MLLAGTVMDIPLHSDPTGSAMYLILFDNGTSAHIPLADMASLIPSPPVSGIGPNNSSSDDDSFLLPPFLRVGSRITYEHDGEYHKGFLARNTDGTYRFSYKTHVKKKVEDWGVNIPNLPFTWVDLCTEGILLPGHVAHSFFRSSVPHDPLTSSPPPSTFDPVANIVSAVNLHRDCPPSLLQALASTHPDREVWLQSYYEEKGGIEDMGTFRKITLGEYRALREKGAPKAIPTMCVLTIKKDEQLMPLRAKSRVVVLGNREGPKASALHPFFGLIVSDFWLVCRLNTVAALNKGIAKTPSARAFFLLRRQLLSVHLPGTPMPARMNIGFFLRLSMAFAGALDTGTTRLMLFFVPLVSLPVRTTLAFTLVTYVTPRTHLASRLPSLCR